LNTSKKKKKTFPPNQKFLPLFALRVSFLGFIFYWWDTGIYFSVQILRSTHEISGKMASGQILSKSANSIASKLAIAFLKSVGS